ncbi:MAG: TIGR04197 family type VII secretion effector [Roseburia sp.]
MTDVFKSSITEAENESNAITMRGASIRTDNILTMGSSNLPAVDNLKEINEKMNSCNERYVNLLKNHAESIRKLGREFDTFDKDLADCMRISK